MTTRPTLHICTACQPDRRLDEGEATPGRLLHAAVAVHPNAASVELREVVCLAHCDHFCTAAIAMPGKWTYVLKNLTPEHAGDLLTYAQTYATHPTGTVLPSRRPASLATNIAARVPA